jgi:hypothetical protein
MGKTKSRKKSDDAAEAAEGDKEKKRKGTNETTGEESTNKKARGMSLYQGESDDNYGPNAKPKDKGLEVPQRT